MRKLTILLLCLMAPLIAARAAEAGPTLLFDTKTGEVLHAYKPFDRWYPASLTKLMTVYVTFDQIAQGRISMNSPVTITANAAAEPPSKMGYRIGTQISVEDAIQILMVKSANDVAVALAEAVGGGSEPRFISEMNRAAARLGMTDSNFVNPHGLPDSRQITSARDMALLTRALIERFPQHQHFFSMPSIQVGNRVMKNHNKLIGRFRGADGMKTGFICASGFNVVSTATRGGRRLGVVVFGSPNAALREKVAAALLEAGFAKGRGFRLFGGPRTKLSDLRRPSRIVQPVNMRAYACAKRPMPPEVASFGYVAQPEVGQTKQEALAMAKIDLREPTTRTEPITSFTAPLPRIRPFLNFGASAPVPTVRPATSASAIPMPPPNPRRAE